MITITCRIRWIPPEGGRYSVPADAATTVDAAVTKAATAAMRGPGRNVRWATFTRRVRVDRPGPAPDEASGAGQLHAIVRSDDVEVVDDTTTERQVSRTRRLEPRPVTR